MKIYSAILRYLQSARSWRLVGDDVRNVNIIINSDYCAAGDAFDAYLIPKFVAGIKAPQFPCVRPLIIWHFFRMPKMSWY